MFSQRSLNFLYLRPSTSLIMDNPAAIPVGFRSGHRCKFLHRRAPGNERALTFFTNTNCSHEKRDQKTKKQTHMRVKLAP